MRPHPAAPPPPARIGSPFRDHARAARVTVKARIGRSRHIAFRIEGARPPSRAGLADALQRAGLPDAKLTRYEAGVALVRVTHARAAAARRILDALALPAGGRVVTLGTSGTVRGAVARFAPELARGRARPSTPDASRNARSEPRQ